MDMNMTQIFLQNGIAGLALLFAFWIAKISMKHSESMRDLMKEFTTELSTSMSTIIKENLVAMQGIVADFKERSAQQIDELKEVVAIAMQQTSKQTELQHGQTQTEVK